MCIANACYALRCRWEPIVLLMPVKSAILPREADKACHDMVRSLEDKFRGQVRAPDVPPGSTVRVFFLVWDWCRIQGPGTNPRRAYCRCNGSFSCVG
jgi:hypothetical protein